MMALVFLAGCLVTALAGTAAMRLAEKPAAGPKATVRESMEYGDSFAELELVDCKGRKCSFPEIKNEYAAVFLLSAGCRSCVEEADAIGELTCILKGDFADVILLWQDEIPWDILSETPIEEAQNYSCGTAPLAGDLPRYYILDDQAEAVFVGKSMDELMQKFMALDTIEIEDLQSAADTSLHERFTGEIKEDQVRMVEFSMVGCKDCEAAAPIVTDIEAQQGIEIKTIYCDKQNVPEEQKGDVDHGNVLAHLYGIRWYPSFVVFQGDKRLIVGQTPQEGLKSALLQALGGQTTGQGNGS